MRLRMQMQKRQPCTSVMPATVCPICPYILFQDTASTNLSRRFYRSFEIPL